MTDGDGLHEDMRHLPPQPGFRSDLLTLDEGTAERLLAGGLDPADAPPQYMRAAMVLKAIAAPPSSEELADEAAAVARLVAVARSSPHRAARRRPPVLTKFIAVKLAAAAVAALSLAGVAGAATGTLPAPAQRVAHRMLGAAGVPSPDDHAATTHGQGQGDHRPTGPDATGAAKAGLCRAWQAGQGGQNGGKEESTAFKALAAAAGGSDKIADYCKDVTAADGQKGSGVGNGAPPSTLPEQSQGHGAGQGAGNGQGQGSGGGSGDENGQGQGQGQGSAPPSQPHPND